MGRKFVTAILSVMIVFTAFVSGIYMAIGSSAIPVDDNADVYAVVGDKKIPLSNNDSSDVKKMLKAQYSKDQAGKCPFDSNIGFEIGNYR